MRQHSRTYPQPGAFREGLTPFNLGRSSMNASPALAVRVKQLVAIFLWIFMLFDINGHILLNITEYILLKLRNN